MTPRHRLTTTLCGLALLLTALPALAQGKGDWHRGRGPGGMDGHRLEHLALRLELSDGQREELRQAFRTFRIDRIASIRTLSTRFPDEQGKRLGDYMTATHGPRGERDNGDCGGVC